MWNENLERVITVLTCWSTFPRSKGGSPQVTMNSVSVYAEADPTAHDVEGHDSMDRNLEITFLGSPFPASPGFDMRSA